MATVATVWIFTNALFLQKGPHPAPIFAARPVTHETVPLAPPRPQISRRRSMPMPAPTAAPAPETADQTHGQLIANIQRELDAAAFTTARSTASGARKTDAAVRDFVQAAGAKLNAGSQARRCCARSARRHAKPAATPRAHATIRSPS